MTEGPPPGFTDLGVNFRVTTRRQFLVAMIDFPPREGGRVRRQILIGAMVANVGTANPEFRKRWVRLMAEQASLMLQHGAGLKAAEVALDVEPALARKEN